MSEDNEQPTLDENFEKGTGACQFHKLEQLLPGQEAIVTRIVLHLREIADRETDNEQEHEQNYAEYVSTRHPSRVFLIDGPRGSGKTSVTLTIRGFLDQLGRQTVTPDINPDQIKKIEEKYEAHTSGSKPDLMSAHKLRGRPERRTCLTLPLISPENMESGQSVMEGIIAQMGEKLRQLNDQNEGETNEVASQLINELHRYVAKGWYFSKRIGTEALLNDAINFQDFINRQSQEAVASHTRMKRWRAFVLKFLDLFQAELLVVAIDDTDISAENTIDALAAMRMYLDHPRIVTLFAGNLNSIRHTLLVDAFKKIGTAFAPLRDNASLTATNWRDYTRREVDEFLEKVLPRQYRNFIHRHSKDFQTIFSENNQSGDEAFSFDDFCREQMIARMTPFINAKIDQSESAFVEEDRGTDKNSRHVENYMGLWLLRNYYRDELTPKTARVLNQLKRQLPDLSRLEPYKPLTTDKLQNMSNGRRRLTVILFFNPGNYQVIQRFGDRDIDVIDWLWQQPNVTSQWRGSRHISFRESVIREGTYSFDYLLFRLDHEISQPYAINRRVIIPKTLLPVPSGNTVWTPEVWEINNRDRISKKIRDAKFNLTDNTLRLWQNRTGLSQLFENPIIPSNCCYFKDVRCLPAISWEGTEGDTVHRTWPVFPIESVGEIFETYRFDKRWDYFRDVVLSLASVPLLSSVSSNEFVRHLKADVLKDFEANTTTVIHESFKDKIEEQADEPEEIDKVAQNAKEACDFFLGQPFEFFPIIRDVYSRQIQYNLRDANSIENRKTALGLENFSPSHIAEMSEEFPYANKLTLDSRRATFRLFSETAIPRYHRLLNDTRQAWHAIRIFQNEVKTSVESPADFAPFVHSHNDRYRIIGIEEINELLGWLSRFNDPSRWFFGNSLSSYKEQFEFWANEEHFPVLSDVLRRIEPLIVFCYKPGEAKSEPQSKEFLNNRYAFEKLIGEKKDIDAADLNEILNKMLSEFLDESKKEGASDEEAPCKNEEKVARAMRSIFMLLYALGPCFSSLIHIDLMGRVYNSLKDEKPLVEYRKTHKKKRPTPPEGRTRSTQGAEFNSMQENESRHTIIENIKNVETGGLDSRKLQEEIEAVAAAWFNFLQLSQLFALMFGLKLEQYAENESIRNNAFFTPAPDLSIESSGIHHDKNADKQQGGGFSGMINDIFLRCEIAENYLRDWYDSVWLGRDTS